MKIESSNIVTFNFVASLYCDPFATEQVEVSVNIEEVIKNYINFIISDESKQKNIYSDYDFCSGSTINFFIG